MLGYALHFPQNMALAKSFNPSEPVDIRFKGHHVIKDVFYPKYTVHMKAITQLLIALSFRMGDIDGVSA